ncbi:MAG: hypothetical protein ACHQRM_12880 [Bacteroidia bacterium]
MNNPIKQFVFLICGLVILGISAVMSRLRVRKADESVERMKEALYQAWYS